MPAKEKQQKLPQAEEVTLKLEIDEAKECLKFLPSNLEGVKTKLEEAIKHAYFWNFLRDCHYLQSFKADFHLTGLFNPPAWSLYCTHPENKGGAKRLYLGDISEEKRNKVTGSCDRDNCPIYKGSFVVHRQPI